MEPFVTEASEDLIGWRKWCILYSLGRARDRLARLKAETIPEILKNRSRVCGRLKGTELVGTQIAATRPLSFVSISPCGGFLASAAWDGECRIWEKETLEEKRRYGGGGIQMSCVVFNPKRELIVAFSDYGGNVLIGKEEGTEILLSSSEERIPRITFHPYGRHLVGGGFDKTWRMWDVEEGREIIRQEGEGEQIYDVCFHPDGGLLGTGSMEGRWILWDTRMGRPIGSFNEHKGQITSIDFSPNGFEVLTSGNDNIVKMWDIRMLRCIKNLFPHTSIVTCAKYEPKGTWIVTTSEDGTSKVWDVIGGSLQTVLDNNETRVSDCDVSFDGGTIVTCGFDRCFRVWNLGS